MTSLGRFIYFDQPGTGASDPVTPGALPTLEQWADSITAVLDDLGGREAVLVASNAAFATGALFAATHPSRTSALVVLGGFADAGGTPLVQDETRAAVFRMWGSGKAQHLVNPDMPWNEDQGIVGPDGTPGGQPKDASSRNTSRDGSGRAGGPSDRPCANPRPQQ